MGYDMKENFLVTQKKSFFFVYILHIIFALLQFI